MLRVVLHKHTRALAVTVCAPKNHYALGHTDIHTHTHTHTHARTQEVV